MPTEIELKELIFSIRQPYKLLILDRYIKETLELIGVSKSKGNPIGEYAEFLTSVAFKAQRMPNAKEGHDLTLLDGTKLEVKGRVFEGNRIPKSSIKASTISHKTFDFLIYVVFNESMRVKYALKLSHFNFQQIATYSEQTNSPPKWIFVAKPALLENPLVEDVTSILREAENSTFNL